MNNKKHIFKCINQSSQGILIKTGNHKHLLYLSIHKTFDKNIYEVQFDSNFGHEIFGKYI